MKLIYPSLGLLFCCGGVEEPTIVDLREDTQLTHYQVSLTGRRDGDMLPVQLVFESSSSKLAMDLRFRIGVPTRLESGQYQWEQDDKTLEGRVRARSVTFLGGQSDNPNVGGVFELLSSDGTPVYRVRLPTSEVKPTQSPIPLVLPSH